MKKFNLFPTRWENSSRGPFSLACRQKRNATRRSGEGSLNLVWIKEEGGSPPAGGRKNKMFISFWWKVITRKLQMDSFQKPSHCLFGQKRTARWYKKKLSQTVKYWILCVWYRLTVKQNKYQAKIAGLDTAATPKVLFSETFSKPKSSFSTRMSCNTLGKKGCWSVKKVH